MNEASLWRLELARHVAPIIARNPKVKAVMLGGAASRGNADAYSDIEIGVFWSEAPTDEDRTAPIQPAGGEFWDIDPYDPQDFSWMEEWGLGGVKMDVRNLTLEGVEQILREVQQEGNTAEFKQIAVSAIQHGIPLYNESLLNEWKAQIAIYPDTLRDAMVRQHMAMDSWCWWVELLAYRGDLPLLYAGFSELTRHMLAVLMGLNRIYHPGFKWMKRLTAEMTIKPDRLDERIRQAFRAESPEAIAILRSLMLEIYDLVDTHLPHIETIAARADFLKQRSQFAKMPVNLSIGR